MGQRLIITEEDRKNILFLYEQTNDQYKKENDFLKRYIGKTFNTYTDSSFNYLTGYKHKIKDISYVGDGISIFYSIVTSGGGLVDHPYPIYIDCKYNPSKLDYKFIRSVNEMNEKPYYNKTLVDDITTNGTAAGIKWCKRPDVDFGMKQNNSKTNNMS